MVMATISSSAENLLSFGHRLSQHELYRLLFDNVPDPIFLIDIATEECVHVSPSVQGLLGLEAETLIGRPLTDFVHPDDKAKVTARSASRRRGRGQRRTVTRMSNADGAWVWVKAAASPVLTPEGRQLTVFTVTNAAERVLAENGLHAARLRLRHLLDQIAARQESFENPDGSYD